MLSGMLARVANRVPASGDDTGLSLIELIVTMVVATIVMAMTLVFFVGGLRSSDNTTASSIDTAKARVILDDWSSLIRVADSTDTGAPQFTMANGSTSSSDDLTFYANVGNQSGLAERTAPVKVQLSLSGGQLVESRYQAVSATDTPYAYPAQPTSTTVLAGCSSDTPLSQCGTPGTVSSSGTFTAYYPPDGCPSGALTVAGLCRIDTNTPATLDDAIAIGISFAITSTDGKHSQAFTTLASVTAGSAA